MMDHSKISQPKGFHYHYGAPGIRPVAQGPPGSRQWGGSCRVAPFVHLILKGIPRGGFLLAGSLFLGLMTALLGGGAVATFGIGVRLLGIGTRQLAAGASLGVIGFGLLSFAAFGLFTMGMVLWVRVLVPQLLTRFERLHSRIFPGKKGDRE